jgi:hypothetical protein
MKQAKTEAAMVVDKFKKEKETEFAAKARSSSLTAENTALERSTEAEIAAMKITFETNKEVILRSSRNAGDW